jgi:hypothetical protein
MAIDFSILDLHAGNLARRAGLTYIPALGMKRPSATVEALG